MKKHVIFWNEEHTCLKVVFVEGKDVRIHFDLESLNFVVDFGSCYRFISEGDNVNVSNYTEVIEGFYDLYTEFLKDDKMEAIVVNEVVKEIVKSLRDKEQWIPENTKK